MKTSKEILYDILLVGDVLRLNNIEKVRELTNIPRKIYNGKRDSWQLAKLVCRILTIEQCEDVINKMPFPFYFAYYPQEEKAQTFFSSAYIAPHKYDYWLEHLSPPKKKGEIKNVTQQISFQY